MKKFVIISDSCSDLDKSLREKYDIDYIPMHFSYDGKEFKADLDYKEISFTEFYDLMREGKRIKTAQINANEYLSVFEKYVKEGYDVLSLSCSSALSHSVDESFKARDELIKKYPESKIICVDTLNACFGLGLLCIRASELRAEGKSIEETAKWIEENKKTVNQECTVDTLKYLKQAGRVSAASAFFGGLLSVKPIIISDVTGINAAVEKVKGRNNSIDRLVERFKDEYRSCPYQKVRVVHADGESDAKILMERVKDAIPDKDVEITLGYIGPIVGATVGPKTIAVYFYGKEVTFNSKAQ
ncbi:MAG: DegV family protein [Clostridia bacterium]|nr:DegV family protein [Clostridia bacterium]